ncbi:MAG TPA: universal stress protein [Chloroflexota bacterium]|jgi:nucleotide-binding universal stress UspA family protein|nr:universal stress protein [Chloroflexota bacterium]
MRILVPLDQSPLGEAKLPVAEAQARAFGAELILLDVLPPEALDPSGAVSPEEARARTYLDTVAARMRAEGVTAYGLVRTGPAAQTIVDEARERGVDLIVIGSNVRSTLPRTFLGSVADEVIRNAPCPVLLVRPHLQAGTAGPVRSFDEDAAKVGPLAQRHLGIRTVEVSRIIGSVGRAHNLGANFRPLRRTREDDQRYERVLRAMAEGRSLPPVELYKLGFGYYVLDGNHRVAAALQLGQLEIDAEVSEFIPLGDTQAQRVFAERRAFERSTGITRIEAANTDTYARLEELIAQHAAEHSLADRGDAARSWYQEVYRPVSRRIRQLGLARLFPGERSADIVLRIADFKREHEAQSGQPMTWPDAVERFADEHGAGGRGGGSRRRAALSLLGRRGG